MLRAGGRKSCRINRGHVHGSGEAHMLYGWLAAQAQASFELPGADYIEGTPVVP